MFELYSRNTIFNCKNGHIVDNILLKDFENTQMIDESLIICDKCKVKNKNNTYNNEMYRCNICNLNLCPLCKSTHDKNHKIIDYVEKDYICNMHNKEYNSFCETCNKDICILCKQEHKEHKIISYEELTIPENIKKKELEDMDQYSKYLITIFKVKIEMIINRLNDFIKNIELYIKINRRNIINYNINNINYNILQNINYVKNDFEGFLNSLDVFFNDNDNKEFLPTILKMYNRTNKNEIDLIYNIPNNEKEIKIFGSDFVSKNKDLCKIIYDNKEYDLTEKFGCNDIKDNILKIKLEGINNVSDLSFMFEGCSSLESLAEISNWKTNYVINMNNMFNGCSSLKMLPDISNWNTSNVFDMSGMFYGCSSLKSLPDISKWDTKLSLQLRDNNEGIEGMFDGCSESLNIPEKFKTNI